MAGRENDRVIVWLNGAFGGGKTATAKRFVAHNPGTRLFDPEWVGYLLREMLADPDVYDFQDYTSWRRLVPVVAAEVGRATGDRLIAVQSVLVEEYWRDLARGFAGQGHEIYHVLLTASEDTLRARIEADESEPEGVRDWRLEHVSTFVEAQSWLRPRADLVIDSTDLTPDEVAEQIRQHLVVPQSQH